MKNKVVILGGAICCAVALLVGLLLQRANLLDTDQTIAVRALSPSEATRPKVSERRGSGKDRIVAPLRDGAVGFSSAHSEAAGLLLLERGTGRPPVDTLWRFKGASGVTEVEVGESGWVELGAGSWQIIAPTGWAVSANDGKLKVVPGEKRSIWLERVVDIEVMVQDSTGYPIQGAAVRWVTRPDGALFDPDYDWWRYELNREGQTDGQGRVRLSGVSCPAGVLQVAAEGFQPASLPYLHIGPDENNLLSVTLALSAAPSQELRFEDSATGHPIAGARIVGPFGPIPGESGPSGRLDLPGWALQGRELRVVASGYCPVHVRIAELSEPIRLMASSQVSVSALGDSAGAVSGVVLWTRLEPPPVGVARPQIPRLVHLDDAGHGQLELPLGLKTAIIGVSSGGTSASVSFVPTAAKEELMLSFVGEGKLEIEIESRRDDEGRAIAVVRYESRGQIRVRESIEGVLVIPRAEDVQDISIEQPGFLRAHLSPKTDSGAPLAGQLTVSLQPEVDAVIRAVSFEGRPLAGLKLSFSLSHQPLLDVPNRPGYQSTSHPEWIQQVSPLVNATTDGDGRWRTRGLVAGNYRLYVSVGRVHLLDRDGGETGFPISAHDVSLSEGGLETIEMDPPRRVRIEAYHALGREPLSSILVRDPTSSAGLRRERPGNTCDLWIPSSVATLRVSSSGLESKVIEIPEPVSHEPYFARVFLEASRPGELRFEGDVDAIRGARLHVYAWDSNELAWETNAHLVWHGYIVVEDPASVPFSIPVDHAPRITLQVCGDDRGGVLIGPLENAWGPGATLRFLVRVSR